MTGADEAALASFGRALARAGSRLRSCVAAVDMALAAARWYGADGRAARADWAGARRAVLAAAAGLERASAAVVEQARQQRDASSVRLERAVDDLEPAGVVPDPRRAAVITGERPQRFDAADGRESVVVALAGTADASRIQRDEIEIRALDNGRFVVVLAGVTDLTDGLERGLPFDPAGAVDHWRDNAEPTVRKMRYAVEAARRDDTDHNEYSSAVVAAMRDAGVPVGAEVMIVGHSFGAYAAMDLAADRVFNASSGAAYHVRLTHVVAAGADVDWRFDEVPATTAVLVVNNRYDLVVAAEDALHIGGRPVRSNQLEVTFRGSRSRAGHDPLIYASYLAGVRSAPVDDWLDHAGGRYADGGVRVSRNVPDPALVPASGAGQFASWRSSWSSTR